MTYNEIDQEDTGKSSSFHKFINTKRTMQGHMYLFYLKTKKGFNFSKSTFG